MPYLTDAQLKQMGDATGVSLFSANVPLGRDPETRDMLLVADADRFAGTYVLGVQGTGKSTLLENLILWDVMAGNAVVVIDPHGDLVDHCLAELPRSRLARTYLLDLEDEAYPFGTNLFLLPRDASSLAHSQVVERIMHVFEVLWPDVLTQANLPRYVRMATHLLLANPSSTLLDMYTLLLDDGFRARLLSRVTDPTVRQFWAVQYDSLKPETRQNRVLPLLGRLESLFAGRSLVRNVVGQGRNTLSFRRAIEQKQLILIKLPLKTVPQDAKLIGTLLLAQLYSAVFSFADIPPAQRPGVSIYCDEFQHFATPDFASLFTEGRKFGVKLTVAHQYRGQLPDYLQQATMTARTKIVFQTTPEDGRAMAPFFPQAPQIAAEDITDKPAEYLLGHGSPEPIVETFIETYLLPLQGYRRGHIVEIRNGGLDVFAGVINFMGMLDGAPNPAPIRVDDPLPYLNRLLHTAMVRRDDRLPIPAEIPRGFANGGIGFFAAVRHAWHDPALLPDFHYPETLVQHDTWMKSPRFPKEQFYHFIFCLRSVMAYLADHPIGRETAASPSVIGQQLATLPRRQAMVSSGEDVCLIAAPPLPQRVSGADWSARLQQVRELTRATYCLPRAEVEASFRAPTPLLPPEQRPALPKRPAPLPPRPATPRATAQPALVTSDGWEDV